MTSAEAIQKAALAYIPATYIRALRHLENCPCDAVNLAAHLGMTLGSTYKLLMVLRELKVICVVQWVRISQTGDPIKIWGLGTKNAKRPPKKTPAERTREYRERQKIKTGQVKLGMFNL